MKPPKDPPDRIHEIRAELGLDAAADEAAANRLNELLEGIPEDAVPHAWRAVEGRHVVVVGGADSAEVELVKVPASTSVIAAGAGATWLHRARRVPEILVTDLDGDMDDQAWCAKKGAVVFVHAHGDNTQALERWIPHFRNGWLAGTCQTPPRGRLLNPGGFTDGDRACFLARALGATGARLVGFDLAGPLGKVVSPVDAQRTRQKFLWAQRLLRDLHASGFPIDPRP